MGARLIDALFSALKRIAFELIKFAEKSNTAMVVAVASSSDKPPIEKDRVHLISYALHIRSAVRITNWEIVTRNTT